ncbi:nucleopolyhedrovirus P10 family protein [Streptomyces sp. NPDC054784]
MTAESLAEAVRRRLDLGRLLPLGDADDTAWIAESAAVGALRRAAAEVRGVVPGTFRLALADPDGAVRRAVPAPPSGLPYGPLRLEAEYAAAADEPLPEVSERLRTALARAADVRLGLPVRTVDLRITALLDGAPGAGAYEEAEKDAAYCRADGAVAAAVAAVPGVAGLVAALAPGGVTTGGGGADGDRAARHTQVEIAVADGRRALDVARAAGTAAATAATGPGGTPATAAVLVAAVDAGRNGRAD